MGAAEELLGSYQHRIDSLTLTPGPKGIFDVTVNGELVFSKHATGRHARTGELLDELRKIVGPDVRPYGS